MKRFLNYLTLPVLIVSVGGIVCFYSGITSVVYICAAVSLLHSILNVLFGKQNNLVSETITLIIGAFISWIFKCNFLLCIAVALCYGEVIVTVVFPLFMYFKLRHIIK